ncbi:unnamed protein product [Cylicostephanus goldi]|uniref:Saposin B-type domain-containing protein n=1 Tax=Cylicostephanus goldi TaxID=71465 RepID=A0A3P6TLW0_CYLGO|nr:unnamed protein product [Cylicostephanus goldi]
MKVLTIVALFLSCFLATALRKKPICKMCENFVEEVDAVVKKEGDVAAALEKFCHEVLNFLIETCQKMILKNLKFIMERLQVRL